MKPITDSLILTWIIKAKEVYMNEAFVPGMCKAFKRAFQYVPKVNRNLAKLITDLGWGDFWVIPMTVEGFMGTLYYGTYSKDEVREIYESKGIGLI